MAHSDRQLLLDILSQLPSTSYQHSVALTIALITLRDDDPNDREIREFIHGVIKSGKWKVDWPVIQFLIKRGDSDARFDLLTSSLHWYLTDNDRERIFLHEFDLRRKDPWAMYVLSDVLRGILLDQIGVKRSNDFRKYIDHFVRHKSYKVRQFGIMVAVYLRPPERHHFEALRKGLRHPNSGMKLNCINAIQLLFGIQPKIPKPTLQLLRDLRFREAVERFGETTPQLSGNANEVLSNFTKYGV